MNRAEHLLTCLGEEGTEVGQRVSKALRFGVGEVQPGQLEDNGERLVGEMRDFLAVAEMLVEDGIIRSDWASGARAHIVAKKAKVERFMDYARSQGALS